MKTTDFIRLICLSAIWGASFLFMRIIVPVLGVLPSSFIRVFFASIGLLIIIAALQFSIHFKGKLKSLLLLGIFSSGIPVLMYSIAALVLPAGYSAIFNATTPLMGILIGALFFSEKLTIAKAAGVLFGLAGVAVLTRTGPVALNGQVLLGAAACLVATSCYGLAGFLTKRWISERGGLDSRLVALGTQLGATALLLPPFIFSVSTNPPATWGGTGVWLAIAGLGFICTSLAYIMYFRLIADIGPVKSLTVTFLIPPFGVFWGWIFLGEQITWAHLGGGMLIAVALWLVLMQHKPRSVSNVKH
ncbi:DMT family transporter [Solimicrobium silvestre]|uniref:DMT family transporter n=1 Tax=Solimicrobium silvestre TaxID=2099400 RepID=UPI001FAF2F7D|nr:DMT family transporter [Solimicrobium silvestre]